MTFHEKLTRRARELGLNKAKAARDVGLPESAINSYLSKPSSMPRADIALKLAAALNVPFDWLVDDAREEWPPPSPTGIGAITTAELRDELGRRMHHGIGRLAVAKLMETKRVDWIAVGEELAKHDPTKRPPAAILAKLHAVQQLHSIMASLEDFDPRVTLSLEEVEQLGIDGESDGSAAYSLAGLERQHAELDHEPGLRETMWLATSVWYWALTSGKPDPRLNLTKTAATLADYASRFVELRERRRQEAAIFSDMDELKDDVRNALDAEERRKIDEEIAREPLPPPHQRPLHPQRRDAFGRPRK